jgi:hypothetical protein
MCPGQEDSPGHSRVAALRCAVVAIEGQCQLRAGFVGKQIVVEFVNIYKIFVEDGV